MSQSTLPVPCLVFTFRSPTTVPTVSKLQANHLRIFTLRQGSRTKSQLEAMQVIESNGAGIVSKPPTYGLQSPFSN
jgi:hypothetical protein